MGASTYLLPVIFMGVISAAAAVAAIVVTFRALVTPRFTRKQLQQLAFEFPDEPRAAPEPVVARAPRRPPPPPPLRLDLGLVSPGSPSRLRIPVSMAAGRILELGLPLWLSTRGGRELKDVRLRIALPTEITYGASLERMAGAALGLPGARAAYSSDMGRTFIDISLPETPSGAEVEIPIPVCIKGEPSGAHAVEIWAEGGGLEPLARAYQLELEPAAQGEVCELVQTDAGATWICRPDEGQRQRDPNLPLDRIGRFKIEEAPAAPDTESRPEPQPPADSQPPDAPTEDVPTAEAQPSDAEPAETQPAEAVASIETD